MSLSDRVRPDVEAGPWIVKEIMKLEAELAAERARAEKAEAAIEQFLAAYPWGPDMPELAGLRAAMEGKP